MLRRSAAGCSSSRSFSSRSSSCRTRPQFESDSIALLRAAALLLFSFVLSLRGQEPLSAFQEKKARALLGTQLPCLGCHELDGSGGRSAPSLTGVGTRRSTAFIRAMIEDPQRARPGSAMPLTRMPTATRDVVIRFLSRGALPNDASAPPRGSAVVVAASPAPASNASPAAAELYARWCASCHGTSGGGDGPNAKYLPIHPAMHASAEQMRDRPDDSLYDAIAGGGAVMGKSARMPAFGATLSRDEIRSLVAYVRILCTCEGPAWSRHGRAP